MNPKSNYKNSKLVNAIYEIPEGYSPLDVSLYFLVDILVTNRIINRKRSLLVLGERI